MRIHKVSISNYNGKRSFSGNISMGTQWALFEGIIDENEEAK
jgi:hypothetical protein